MAERSEVTIKAVGDFMLERRLDSADIASVNRLLAGSDLVVANLDTVLSNLGEAMPKWANLRGPRELAGDLRALGIDVAVLANNHAMDFGAEALLDMIDALHDAGVQTVGAGPTLDDAIAPLVVERNGRSVALLAVACTIPAGSDAGPDRPGIAPLTIHYAFVSDESLLAEQPGSVPEVQTWANEDDTRRVCHAVRAAREMADDVLVFVHWGVPSPWRPSAHPIVQEHQRALGRALIDAGADAVIGNHPHELHGVEFYAGKPIAYCVGNFWIDTISAYSWMGRESIALNLTLGCDLAPVVSATPLLLDDGGVPRLEATGRTVDILRRMSQEFGVNVEAGPDAPVRIKAPRVAEAGTCS